MRRWLRRAAVLSLVGGVAVSVAAGLWLRRRPHLWVAWQYRHPPARYRVPVAGLEPEALQSTWHAPRSGGRLHEGADLFAPRGTAVVSATDGIVWRIREGGLGGRTVTVLGAGPAFYYYAHLDEWADALVVGEVVDAGRLLGTVGNTGNARRTPPHLHFGVYPIRWPRPGAPVDPIPLLRGERGR